MSADTLYPGFETRDVESDPGVHIRIRVGGRGAPLLLLHGHPQTHAIWHKIAPALAERFTLVLADLRGYGDSSKPPGDADHANYSKRVMAHDMLHVMRALGHPRFSVLAHDRGARVAHRLAIDHAEAVQRLAVLDIAPTLAMYEQTSDAFARAYWHWFFLIQPAPLPERLIEADPRAYVREVMGRRPRTVRSACARRIRARDRVDRHRTRNLRGLPRVGRHRSRPRPRRPRTRRPPRHAAARAVGARRGRPSLLRAAR